MNDNETQFGRDDVVAELDVQIEHAAAVLKGRRGNARRSLLAWKSALEGARQSLMDGTTTEAQVSALVRQGCRLAGAVPSHMVGHDGDQPVWITTGEAMARNVAVVQQLGGLLRTQIDRRRYLTIRNESAGGHVLTRASSRYGNCGMVNEGKDGRGGRLAGERLRRDGPLAGVRPVPPHQRSAHGWLPLLLPPRFGGSIPTCRFRPPSSCR